jgi:carbonic anhydrase
MGACDHLEMGSLTELLAKLQPAVYQETLTLDASQRNSSNMEFVENVAKLNVQRSVKTIIDRSYILEQMIEKGEVAIIGAMHDLDTGKVEFYSETLIENKSDIKTRLI